MGSLGKPEDYSGPPAWLGPILDLWDQIGEVPNDASQYLVRRFAHEGADFAFSDAELTEVGFDMSDSSHRARLQQELERHCPGPVRIHRHEGYVLVLRRLVGEESTVSTAP